MADMGASGWVPGGRGMTILLAPVLAVAAVVIAGRGGEWGDVLAVTLAYLAGLLMKIEPSVTSQNDRGER